MPIHDWTKVLAGIFHDFHHTWIAEIKRALNRGVLPDGYYALAEQIAGRTGPDVIALEMPTNGVSDDNGATVGHGVALAAAPPQVRYRMKAEVDVYAEKAKSIAIRHASTHEVVAMIEIVSPGNKSSRGALRDFVDKAMELLRNEIHLLIIDLFPPSPRDPQGIHGVIWGEFTESAWTLPEDAPLTLVSYAAGMEREAFVEPTAVGRKLLDMPLFLEPDEYVSVPLEATYQSAWEAVPKIWRDRLEAP